VAVTLSLLVAVFLLSSAARQEAFGEHYTLLLIVNLIGIAALLLLIAFNVARLVGHLRRRELGSRLTLRMLGFFVPIALIPLALVYYFSVQFISRGIDSWFDVRIEQALNDALLLGRTSLEAIKEDQLQRVRDALPTLSELGSDRDLVRELDLLRERAGFSEITLFARNGRVLAYSSESSSALMPTRRPTKGIVDQVRSGTDYANFEPAVGGGLDLRVVVPVFAPGPSLRMLQVVHPLPLRHARLGESVQAAFAEYERFSYLRAPLKFSFVLTLTLVTLMTLLISVWAALYFAQRLTAPIGDLAQGTRAVAAGDYETRLPVASSDELGVLVQSFNDMTDKVRLSQSAQRRGTASVPGHGSRPSFVRGGGAGSQRWCTDQQCRCQPDPGGGPATGGGPGRTGRNRTPAAVVCRRDSQRYRR
jgi:nitrogen fixation/metabolism regulation signal transduction histidine kinase